MQTVTKEDLLEMAVKISNNSYSPYSRFRVGAALLCKDGSIITGVNVENRSFGLTTCAERSALFFAVSSGKKDFTGIAVYSPDSSEPLPPCGACRQVLSEFAKDDFYVIFSGKNKKYLDVQLSELLPYDSLHELKKE